MKARLKILRDELLKKLSPRFAEFNFELNAAKAQFRSKREWGSVAIMLNFIEHGDADFDVTGSVGLRIDAVEDLVNETHPMATKAEKLSTFTMGAELGNISEGKQKRWSVKNEGDVDPVAADFVRTVEAVGLPYLEKYSDLNNALEALSGNEPFNWLHRAIHGVRCQRVRKREKRGQASFIGEMSKKDACPLFISFFSQFKHLKAGRTEIIF